MSSWSFGQRVIVNHTRTVNQTGTQRTDAFNDGITYVRVTSDTTGVFVAFGKTPTAAVSTGIRLVANEPKTFKVDNADKLAAIIASSTANVFVEELSE